MRWTTPDRRDLARFDMGPPALATGLAGSRGPCTVRRMTERSWVAVTISDNIANVMLRAQGKASRMGPAFWAEMPALFAELDASDDVRVIVLRGEGESFSNGLDLAAMGPELRAGRRSRVRCSRAREALRDDPAHAGLDHVGRVVHEAGDRGDPRMVRRRWRGSRGCV